MKSLKSVLSLCFFLTSVNSFAGLWVEPFVGYSVGSYEITAIGSGVYKYDFSGPGLGARLGYKYWGVVGGLTYAKGMIEDKASSVPAGQSSVGKDKYNTQDIGVFLGFTGIPMVNVWANYYFSNSWEVSKTNTVTGADKGDKWSGDGMGLGAGFTGLPFISINLEYKMYSFDEFENGLTGVKTKFPNVFFSELDVKEIFLSVSLPLEFFD